MRQILKEAFLETLRSIGKRPEPKIVVLSTRAHFVSHASNAVRPLSTQSPPLTNHFAAIEANEMIAYLESFVTCHLFVE